MTSPNLFCEQLILCENLVDCTDSLEKNSIGGVKMKRNLREVSHDTVAK